jgi:hypothetical protein
MQNSCKQIRILSYFWEIFESCFSVREGPVFKEKRYLINFDQRSVGSKNLKLQSTFFKVFKLVFTDGYG